MKKLRLTILSLALASPLALSSHEANAQNPILTELYGRGVHAYYAGRSNDAYNQLTMAITNGLEDPRAYYFRGIVADAMGRPYEAEADWNQGAKLEAQGKIVGSIGRALSRFQGSGRLKLETIRRQAKLQFLAESAQRSKQRFGEIQAAEGDILRSRPAAPAATPPPMPADDNPFGDEPGQAAIDSDDALEGAMTDPFAGDASAPADSSPAADDGGADPFGGGDAMESDPFGGGGDAADPFGGSGMEADPFGGSDAADPFGGDPFGG